MPIDPKREAFEKALRTRLGHSPPDILRDVLVLFDGYEVTKTEQPDESITKHPQWPLVAKEQWEAEQILGKALGYPLYKDDPKNFPDCTEADGVCTGEHTLVTIAMEAASRLKREFGTLAEESRKDAIAMMTARYCSSQDWPAETIGSVVDPMESAFAVLLERFDIRRKP